MIARRISPATAIWLLATGIALAGGAYAATASSTTVQGCVKHRGGGLYVAKQCAHGDRRLAWPTSGRVGASGPAGAQGPQGATGPAGATAELPATLPSGATEEGVYGLVGVARESNERPGTAVSFKLPLASPPTVELVEVGKKGTTSCPGSAAAPKAKAGFLCIYEGEAVDIPGITWEEPISTETGGAIPRYGLEIAGFASATGHYIATGSWAVTAP